MPDQHIIIDLGPNVLPALLALFTFLTSTTAAYFAFKSKAAIDTANSHLAIALNNASNPAGESKLTITPLAVKEG